MKITADTNLLVRAAVEDDELQARKARQALAAAELVALTLPALCEFVWVLDSLYEVPRQQIAAAVRQLICGGNVVLDRPAAEAGLAQLDDGGDFADGVIAYDGRWLGADEFVSFDRQAVRLMARRGEPARLLA